MGILRFDRQGRIEAFEEKPNRARLAGDGLERPAGRRGRHRAAADQPFVASLGIYVFSRRVLLRHAGRRHRWTSGARSFRRRSSRYDVHSYFHRDYWADVGTVRVVLRRQHQPDAAEDAVQLLPPDAARSSRGRASCPRPGSIEARLTRSIVAEGASLCHASLRTRWWACGCRCGAEPRCGDRCSSGADLFEDDPPERPAGALGVGHDCVLDGVIVDKNARIGEGARLTNAKRRRRRRR